MLSTAYLVATKGLAALKALEKHASDVEDTVLTMLIDLVKLWGDGTCLIYMFNLLQIT